MKHARIHYQREARKAHPMKLFRIIATTACIWLTIGALGAAVLTDTPDALPFALAVLGFAGVVYLVGGFDDPDYR